MRLATGIGPAILFVCAFVLYGAYQLIAPRTFAPTPITLTIPPGATVRDVADRVSRSPIAIQPWIFELYFSFRHRSSTIKAGEYTVQSPVTVPSLARSFVIGTPKRELTLTLIEGWSVREMSDYLVGQGISGPPPGELSAGVFSGEFGFLKNLPSSSTLEGYLFPDTYRVFADASSADVARKALENFNVQFSQKYRERAYALGRSPHEIVTIASIVEREAQSDTDRARVADIINRRLAKGMLLGMDSTINYITGKGKTRSDLDDLSIDSPYNTYKHPGLPPGPISNPGLSSLKATLWPEANPYWYFLTTNDGQVIYSTTFEEHIRNKRKYLRNG